MDQLFNTGRYLIGKGVDLRIDVILLPSASILIDIRYRLDSDTAFFLADEHFRLFESPAQACKHLKRVFRHYFKGGLQYA